MKEEIRLEQYYEKNGKLGWDNMFKWAKEAYWINSDSQRQLLENMKHNEEISFVIFARLGGSSNDWINQKVPALDYLTPLECLESPNLIKRLKECLMRMP